MHNPNWPRWVHASLSKHFETIITAGNLPIFFEGDDRRTRTLRDYCEYRNDGPRIRELSNNYYRLFAPVNILVVSGMNDVDVHRIQRSIGLVTSAFTKTINVFRFGDGVDDDGSLLGCMVLIQDRRNDLKINHFGQIDETTRLQQASVEGHYECFLNGG